MHMAQQMPLPLTISCSSKSRLVLPSWFYYSGTGSSEQCRTKSRRAIKQFCVCVYACVWLIRCRDITIILFFKMAASAILDFLKFTIFIGMWDLESLVASVCQMSSKLVNPQWTYYIQFFDFSRCQPPSCWIFEIWKFYWLTGSGGPRCITLPNFIKIHQLIAELS